MAPVWMGGVVSYLSERDWATNIWSWSPRTREERQLTFHADFDVKSLGAGQGVVVYDARDRKEDVPLTYFRFDGVKVPGYPGQDQLARAQAKKSKAYCQERGLATPQDCIAWLRKNKLMVKRAPVIEREPGCDDE